MIKRRFYKLEHKQKDGGSESDSASSSSSSDSEVEAQSAEDSEPEAVDSHEREEEVDDEEEPEVAHTKLKPRAPPSPSSSSGYESEESSGNEIPADSSDSEKDGKQLPRYNSSNGEMETGDKDGSIGDDAAKHVLVCKSVYKCKICPRIVCLNEESLKTHLQSKRHARSEKLLSSGRLKRMLNSDGEEEVLEEEGETHAERHARILALAKANDEKEIKKKRKGRQRQRQRMKKKQKANSGVIEAGKKSIKRRRQGPK